MMREILGSESRALGVIRDIGKGQGCWVQIYRLKFGILPYPDLGASGSLLTSLHL